MFIPREYDELINEIINRRVLLMPTVSNGKRRYLGKISKRTKGAVIVSRTHDRRLPVLSLPGELQLLQKTMKGSWFKFKPPVIKL